MNEKGALFGLKGVGKGNRNPSKREPHLSKKGNKGPNLGPIPKP